MVNESILQVISLIFVISQNKFMLNSCGLANKHYLAKGSIAPPLKTTRNIILGEI